MSTDTELSAEELQTRSARWYREKLKYTMIIYDIDADTHVATITLNRPEKMNALSHQLRGECLNCGRLDTLLEAQVVIEGWQREYNQIRPHSSLNYRSPAPEAWMPHYQPRPSLEVPVLS